MKTKTLVLVTVLFVVVLAGLEGYASEKQAIAGDDAMKKFEGTNINNEYSSWAQPQKCDITADKTIVEWVRVTQKKPSWIGDFVVVESWTDAEGNTYCTLDLRYRGGDFDQELWRLDNSGKVFERTFTRTFGHKYPDKIEPDPDPNASPRLYYLIYQRLQKQ